MKGGPRRTVQKTAAHHVAIEKIRKLTGKDGARQRLAGAGGYPYPDIAWGRRLKPPLPGMGQGAGG